MGPEFTTQQTFVSIILLVPLNINFYAKFDMIFIEVIQDNKLNI